jgi:hypothetical protein
MRTFSGARLVSRWLVMTACYSTFMDVILTLVAKAPHFNRISRHVFSA